MNRFRRYLLAAALAVGAVACLQQAAFADVPTAAGGRVATAPPSDSKNAGMGVDGMVKAPDLRGGNQPMLFEKYAPLDYTIHIDLGSAVIGAVTNPTNTPTNTFGNLIADLCMSILMVIGTIATRAVEWSLSLNLIADAGGAVGSVVNGLRQHFYGQLQQWALIGLGIVVVYALLMGRHMRAMTAIGWAVVAIVIGGIFMADPAGQMGNVEGFTSWAGQSALAGIGSVDAAGINRDPTTSQGSAQNAELRTFANRTWQLWTYEPWTAIEFGQVDPKVPGTNRQLGIELLDKNSGRNSSFDADFQAMPQPVKDWYNGDSGVQRGGVALLALILSAIAGVLLLAIVVRILLAAIAVLMLVMGCPVVLLVAIIPGIGQVILLRWLELLVKNFAVAVIMSIFLGLVMLLAGIMAGLAATYGWLVVAGIQVLILAWAIWNHKMFLAFGHRISNPKVSAASPALAQSKPAVAVDRQLHHAQRRAVRPLMPARTPVGGTRALPGGAAQPAAARAGQTAASAGRTAASTGGTAAAGVGTAGTALVALAAVKAGRAAVRGYHSLRHQSQAPLAHFVGGMPQRPALPSHGRSPSLFLAGAQQVRAIHSARRLPPPASATTIQPQSTAALPRPRRPINRAAAGSGRPPISLTAGGAKVNPAPKAQRKPSKWGP